MDRTLPQELLSYVLASIADLQTLFSAIGLSRSIHDAYRAHRQGILKDVTCNQVGDNLRIALRLARVQLYGLAHPGIVPEELPEVHEGPDEPINNYEVQVLSRNALAILRFESHYSQKWVHRFHIFSDADWT